MTPRLPMFLVIAALVVACSRSSAIDEEMKRDLEAASTATLEMAPRGQATTVVSGIEQKKPTLTQVAPVRRMKSPARTAQPPVSAAAAPTEPALPRPISTPRVQPPPPGGYKTMGEVIRNAPFPINPATTRRP